MRNDAKVFRFCTSKFVLPVTNVFIDLISTFSGVIKISSSSLMNFFFSNNALQDEAQSSESKMDKSVQEGGRQGNDHCKLDQLLFIQHPTLNPPPIGYHHRL